jgi:hypothetical protein
LHTDLEAALGPLAAFDGDVPQAVLAERLRPLLDA